MTYTLQRISQSEEGMFGVLKDGDTILCHTCELPWHNNHPDTSCIPAGDYHCIPHNGEEWKKVWEVSDVPNRSGILFHAGNTVDDSKGCILVGTSEGWIGTQMAVLHSLSALNQLRAKLPDSFDLTILNPT